MGEYPIIIDGRHQIITIGDSLTAGSQPSINEYAPFEDITTQELIPTSYPFMLGEMLSKKWGGDLVLNLGRSGSTSQDWLPNQTWKKRGVKNFPLNGRPLDEIIESTETIKLCLIMIGTNDTNHSIVPDWISRPFNYISGYEDEDFIRTKENIITCLLKLKEKGIVSYLAKIPCNRYQGGLRFLGLDRIVFYSQKAQKKLDNYVKMTNSHINSIVKDYHFLVKAGPDFYTITQERQDIWLKDGLHLNTNGYRLMAETWANLLLNDGIVIRE